MKAYRHVGFAVLVAAFAAGCAGSDGAVVEVTATDASTGEGIDAVDAPAVDAGADVPADVGVDVPDVPERCGNGVCQRGETCITCPLDCNECPRCDMAPTCTGALANPTSSTALSSFDNTVGDNERTNYACGTDLGVPVSATTCTDPLLRIRVKQISIRRGWFDIGSNLYCVISAEDGMHSELMVTLPHPAAGNQHTTTINLGPPEQNVVWGQGDLYRSISNLTISYRCYLTSSAGAAMSALMAIADRAGAVAGGAGLYGWVFSTVSVLSTVIGSSLTGISDTQVMDVQQTIDARALLTLTNGRTWNIRSHHGNINLSGVWDMTLNMESWGCANVRTTVQ